MNRFTDEALPSPERRKVLKGLGLLGALSQIPFLWSCGASASLDERIADSYKELDVVIGSRSLEAEDITKAIEQIPVSRLDFADYPSLSAHGKLLAFVGYDHDYQNRFRHQQIMYADLSSGEPHLVGVDTVGVPGLSSCQFPGITDDGATIAYERVISDSAVIVHKLKGGRTLRFKAPNYWNHAPAISGNGKVVAFTSMADDKSHVLHYANLESEQLFTLQSPNIHIDILWERISLSEDGTKIAFTGWRDDKSHIYLLDTEQHTLQQIGGLRDYWIGNVTMDAQAQQLVFTGTQARRDSSDNAEPNMIYLFNASTGTCTALGTGRQPSLAPNNPCCL